ncbi:MAG: T9SS C-terminal target domain-containing protein [Candidatus Zixiibacteriota bacterium]|nr:MAG: T9SS C-terminal target domain-containing protein [candidate division Zixibacteria bacterium]
MRQLINALPSPLVRIHFYAILAALLFTLPVQAQDSAKSKPPRDIQPGQLVEKRIQPGSQAIWLDDGSDGKVGPIAPPSPSGVDGWVTILNETFEGIWPAGAWSVSGNPTWDDDDYQHHNGSWAAWCANGGSLGVDPQYNNYLNNMFAWMIYGPFDLSNATNADFTYWTWYEIENSYDELFVGVSHDGNSFNGYSYTGNQLSWVSRSVPNMSGFVGDNSVWIGFLFESDGSVTYDGAWIDDILVRKYIPDPMTITVTSPNGGEHWAGGNPHPVTWTTTNPTGNVKIELLLGTSVVHTISSSIPASAHSYPWTVPTTLSSSNNYKVRITSLSTSTIQDASNSTFCIFQAPTLVSPLNNQTVGNPVTFSWNAVPGASYTYKLWFDGGGPVTETSSTSYTNNFPGGLHTWDVTAHYGSESSQSSGTRNVYVENWQIFVNYPNGGETLYMGEPCTISWTKIGPFDHFNIYLSTNGGSSWNYTLATGLSGSSTSWTWTVGEGLSLAGGSSHRIQVVGYYNLYNGGGSVSDASNSNFTISWPTLTVTSPNGGEVWAGGNGHPITWSSSHLSSSSNVKIELMKGGSLQATLATSTTNDGYYSWTVGSGLPNAADYKIKITSLSYPSNVQDESDNYFTVMQAPALQSPSNNSTVTNPVTFTWGPAVGALNYEVWVDGSVAHTTSGTQTSWQSTTQYVAGTSHTWFVEAVNGSEVTNAATSWTFNLPIAEQVTVTSPNGSEVWAGGASHNITWTSQGVTSTIDIDLFSGGSHVLDIATGISNTGSYAWALPTTLANTSNYQVKVSSSNANDMSDGVFTIMQAPSLQAPQNNSTVFNPVTLDWDAVTGAGSYQVYVDGALAQTVTAPQTNWPSTFATTSHSWYVKAVANTELTQASTTWNFTVSDIAISVTSPGSGTVWAGGNNVTITWTSQGLTGNVKIELMRSSMVVSSITNSTPIVNLSYSWTVPATLENDDDYQVKVTSLSNPTISGTSNLFPIMQAPALVTPQNNAWVNNPVSFQWNTVIGATAYQLYVDGQQIATPNQSPYVSGATYPPGSTHTWYMKATAGNVITLASETRTFSMVPNVDIQLIPWQTPTTIPAGGGSFSYFVTLSNLETTPQPIDGWIMQYTPMGSWQGPMLGPVSVTIPGGSSITRQRIQFVPSTASPGVYIYRGYLGDYPDVKWDSSSFNYTKLSTGDGNWVGEWQNDGESFDPYLTMADNSATAPPVPEQFTFRSNYPNPFNPATTISFSLPEISRVSLKVYDLQGRLVADLVDGTQEAGVHSVTFDASHLASGLYFARIQAGSYTEVMKMMLVK